MNIDQILAHPALRARIEKALAARGNGGDTMIAHINPQEAGLLRSMGGQGSINPKTGLRQFLYGGGTSEGTDAAHPSGGLAGEGARGGGIRGGDTRADPGAFGGGTSDPAYGGSGDPSASYTGGTGYASHGAYHNAVQNALGDWNTYANSSGPLGFLGAHMLGLGWVDPTKMIGKDFASGTPVPSNPNTSVDALGLGLGALGFLAPGLGTLANLGLYGARKLGAIPGDFGTIDAGNWGGGIFGGSGSGSNTPGSIGGNGNGGFFGGVSGGAANGGLGPTTPTGPTAPAQQQATQAAQGTQQAQQTAAAQTPPASPALMPLMSQASPDLTGGRFGPVPSFATQPYQIGTTPVNMAPPQIPGTPFAPPPTTGGTGGGTGGTGGGTQHTWQTNLLAQYPQLAQWLQANPIMARRWGYA